jgi:hypothetical protein
MNDLEQMVLEIIGENTDSPDVFTDTDLGMEPIRDSLNDAIEEICMFKGANKRVYHLPLKASKTFYRLDVLHDEIAWITDCWLVNQKRRLTGTNLVLLESKNPGWMSSDGPPLEYFQVGFDIFGVYPKVSSDGDIIEITAAGIPARYATDKERVKLRDDFKWAAVDYAVSEFFAGRGDAKTAMEFHGRYLEKLGMQELYSPTVEKRWQFQTAKRAH